VHVLVGLIIAFLVGLVVWERNHESIASFFIVVAFLILIAVVIAAFIGFVVWTNNLHKKEAEKQEHERRLEESRAFDARMLRENIDRTQRLYERANRQYLSSLDFTDLVRLRLEEAVNRAQLFVPENIWELMLRATKFIYEHTIPNTELPPPTADHPDTLTELQMKYQPFADFAAAYGDEKYADAFVRAFMPYLRQFPKSPEAHQFEIPITDVVDVKSLASEIIVPFMRLGFKNPAAVHALEGAKSAWMEMGGKGELIYPSHYEGEQDVPTLYLHPMLQPLFWVDVPWGLTDQARTQHHRALGAPGSGKTTYLSHYILHDLPKVAEGKASIVVLDSQRLARQIPHLEIFAKDHPLYENIIIADADPNYALALNPFQIKNEKGERDISTGADILTYALSGMTEDGSTDIMTDALGWIIRGAAYHPDASLEVLKEFFKPQATKRRQYPFPELYGQLDADTRYYFDVAFNNVAPQTSNAILNRLMALTNNRALHRMLNASTCNLNLISELHNGGKVLFIDADQSKFSPKGAEVFGRLFIAFLSKLVDRRGAHSERSLKHVFVVIDEAHDYIKTDARFASMLVKARNKRVCLTVAHHNDGQILNPQTKHSLQHDVFIRSYCTSRELDDGTPIPEPARIETGPPDRPRVRTVPFKKLDWERDFPQMTNAQYHELRQLIFEKYGDQKKDPEVNITEHHV